MNEQTVQSSEREVALGKYKSARTNLLLMLVLTLINIVLLFTGADVMMLFSATVPYYAVIFGMITEVSELLIAGCVFAGIVLLVYLLCWIFSKKHYGWMIAALVLFILDSVLLVLLSLGLGDFSGILDIVIHAWVLYYLVIGVKYGHKLKNLPEDPAEALQEAPPASPEF